MVDSLIDHDWYFEVIVKVNSQIKKFPGPSSAKYIHGNTSFTWQSAENISTRYLKWHTHVYHNSDVKKWNDICDYAIM